MASQMKHNYATSKDAINGLVQLAHKIDARDFETAFVNASSAGSTKRKIDEVLAELNSAKQTTAEIVRKTREVLVNADASFAEADKAAEELFEGAKGDTVE